MQSGRAQRFSTKMYPAGSEAELPFLLAQFGQTPSEQFTILPRALLFGKPLFILFLPF